MKDYYLVPERVWKGIKSWYGNTRWITNLVISYPKEESKNDSTKRLNLNLQQGIY
jgi:hypothetical protein